MKIKKLNLMKLISYPHIFNPFVYIILIIFILFIIFCSWWRRIDYHSSWVYAISISTFKEACQLLFLNSIGVIINTFWFHRELTNLYVKYLKNKIFPYYGLNDWRRQYELDESYNRFHKLNRKVNEC